MPKLLVGPQKWARDRGEDEIGREGTYLKVMIKRSVLVRNNRKYQNNILHDPRCALPETSINQGQEVLTNFYNIFAEFFNELDRFHACPEVAAPHHRGDWTHQPRGAVVTDMEDRYSEDEDSVMTPLI